MTRVLLAVVFGTALIAAEGQSKAKKPPRGRPAAATMTGCMDQRGQTYVLLRSGTAATASTLHGRALSSDNFARYIGQTVKVTGESKGGAFHVDKVETIADTCR